MDGWVHMVYEYIIIPSAFSEWHWGSWWFSFACLSLFFLMLVLDRMGLYCTNCAMLMGQRN